MVGLLQRDISLEGHALHHNRPMPTDSDTRSDVERLPLDGQRRLQEELLPAQIARVRAGSPFYAERLGEGAVDTLDELASLPFVTKAELLEAQARGPAARADRRCRA